MKAKIIVILWFAFIGLIAALVSCGSTQHCDAYGQAEIVNSRTVSK